MKTFENPIERLMEYEMYSEILKRNDVKLNKNYDSSYQKSINVMKNSKKRIRKK